MDIYPSSVVRFLRNVPLERSYLNTLWFPNKNAQSSYFYGRLKPPSSTFQVNSVSYQRVNSNAIRVQIPIEDLYDCNYLMFSNEHFENKWFYAFITNFTYINNNVTEVSYQIDVIQTWFFDYTLNESFIEREHSATDVIGENTVPENLELGGDYIVNYTENWSSDEEFVIGTSGTLIATTMNENDLSPYTGVDYINDIQFAGINYIYYPHTSYWDSALNNFLTRVHNAGKDEAIIAIYTVPAWVRPEVRIDPQLDCDNFVVSVPKRHGDINNYIAHNKKLYTYPYNFLRVRTDTDVAEYKYEFFNESVTTPDTCFFKVFNAYKPTPSASLVPLGYLTEHVGGSKEVKSDYRLSITNFPQSAFATDVYKVYLAQNASSLAVKQLSANLQGISGIVNAGLTGASGHLIKGAKQGVDALSNYLIDISEIEAKKQDIERKPAQMTGTQTSDNDLLFGFKTFIAEQCTIRAEYAKKIDQYFDMFGYATHNVKVPNTNVRPHWTYTKTIGCTINGNIPADDEARICEIYDNGIRFWKNPTEVGNYSLDNSV